MHQVCTPKRHCLPAIPMHAPASAPTPSRKGIGGRSIGRSKGVGSPTHTPMHHAHTLTAHRHTHTTNGHARAHTHSHTHTNTNTHTHTRTHARTHAVSLTDNERTHAKRRASPHSLTHKHCIHQAGENFCDAPKADPGPPPFQRETAPLSER